MYKIIKFKEYEMSRDITFLNQKTQEEEICFDDETFFSGAFDFLEIGKEYNIKIILLFCKKMVFGKLFKATGEIQVMGDDFWCLEDRRGNVYYVDKKEVNLKIGKKYRLNFGRKEILEIV